MAAHGILRHARAMTLDPASRRPTISLVIPAYNEEDYLPACLDAVMANVAAGVAEIIVVDNASTDGTRAVIERYPIVRYVLEPEKGITRARQRGFAEASGDILAYVDADTMPPPGWIDQISRHFARADDLACLSGPYSFYDLGGLHNRIATAYFTAARPLSIVFGSLLIGGNFAIRRSVLEAMGGFDSSIAFYGEDVDIGRRASKHGRVYFSPRLRMPTSGRRLRKEGFGRMAAVYFVNFFSIVLRSRPATMTYKDVR